MTRTRSTRRYTSSADTRRRSQNRQGMALIAACLLGFAALLIGAAMVDASHGITVDQSLRSSRL